MRKPAFCIYAKTIVQLSCTVTAQLCWNWLEIRGMAFSFYGSLTIGIQSVYVNMDFDLSSIDIW